MLECPVCNNKFEDNFALQGHIRLKQDTDHIYFRQQQPKKQKQEIIKNSILQPTNNSIRSELENIIRNKEKQFIKDENDDKMCQKLEALLRKDREADKKSDEDNYNRGWNDRDKLCKVEINQAILIERKKNEKYCQQKIIDASTKMRDKVLEQCQHSINITNEKCKREYIFNYWCPNCNRYIPLIPGSFYYENIIDLMRCLNIICPECSITRGLSHHFHSLSYIDMNNRISQLEMVLR
jgi:hypothetical protein